MHLPRNPGSTPGPDIVPFGGASLLASSSNFCCMFICFWSSLVSIDETIPIRFPRPCSSPSPNPQVSSCLWLVLPCSSCDCCAMPPRSVSSLVPLTHSGYRVRLCPLLTLQRYGNTCLLINLFFFVSLECLFVHFVISSACQSSC